MEQRYDLSGSLLHWYDYNKRILPWRENKDPYRIWISEIMLQQTRVEAVKPYFDRFMEVLPTVYDLAKVDDDRLMKLWEGLGYYNRARNLKAAAQTIVEEYGGQLPADYDKLLSLKGIGMYTAGAIGSIAFELQVPAVDGNVLRVAKESRSIWSVFIKVMPAILILILVILAISKMLSDVLTKSLLLPIEQMSENLDHLEDITTYKELMPFINTIQEQHKNILMNAKMRQEFTANVSHELKTPLTAISGYSELIQNGMTNEEETIRFAGEIHKSAKRLLTLINDTIRLSQLDTSEQKVIYEAIDLYKIAEDCVNMLKFSAENHGITISIHGTNAYLEGNKEMLEEVVYNLCDNAIRYNNEGGKVDVTVKPVKGKIYLCVEDNGIGISKEHQERIFERFYRVDKSRSKSTGGTGLGLAIVKHIIQQHGAHMELTSEKGKGTKIEIEFSKSR